MRIEWAYLLEVNVVGTLLQDAQQSSIGRVSRDGMNDRERELAFSQVLAEALALKVLHCNSAIKQVGWVEQSTGNVCNNRRDIHRHH